MTEEQARVPKLRFPSFTDAWEQRKLSEVSERVRGNDGRMDLPTLTISAGSGWLDQCERFSGNIAGKEQKKYTLLKKGQLSYNHGNSKLAKFGAVFELRTYEEALVPHVYHSFQTNELAIADFIEYLFDTKRPDKELGKLVSSGARMDGLLNINFDDFTGIKFLLPSVEEQKKIARLLRDVDDLIAVHRRKLSHLDLLKKGLLQEMFPKQGEAYPEIRFPGFTDDWEQRKLGDLLEERNSQRSQSNSYPLVSFTVENGVTPKTDRYQREQLVRGDKAAKKYKVTYLDDIVYNPANLKFGAISRNAYGRAVFSPIYVTFRVKDKQTVPRFIEGYVKRDDFIKYSLRFQQGTVYERQSVSPDSFLGLPIPLPSIDEQRQIGAFFASLDDLIALHQRKLTHLQQQKKALLQQMFV